MLTQIKTDLKQQFENIYKELSVTRFKSEPPYLQELRADALDSFRQKGFPSTKNEEWKYTNIIPYFKKTNYIYDNDLQLSNGKSLKEFQYYGKDIDAYKIYLMDGLIDYEKSNLPENADIEIKPIMDCLDNDQVKDMLTQKRDYGKNPFLALNTALFAKGVYIEIGKNVILDKPIHLVNMYNSYKDTFVQSKNCFLVRKGSQAEIIESVNTFEENSQFIFRNASTEIEMERNSHLYHYKLQKGNKNIRQVEHSEIKQVKHAVYTNYTFSFPGYEFIRNNLNLSLAESDIESHMYGLYLPNERQLIDNHTHVDHQQPNCNSNQKYKGILMGRGRGVFNGKIYVHSIAQQTEALQQNNNILLGDNSVIYTKPQLEIYADDVICTHGCTIGQLDEEAKYYLRTRGIGEKEAEGMLVNAFSYDVTRKVKNEQVQELLDETITATMKEHTGSNN